LSVSRIASRKTSAASSSDIAMTLLLQGSTRTYPGSFVQSAGLAQLSQKEVGNTLATRPTIFRHR
jgi:hypothetical protein